MCNCDVFVDIFVCFPVLRPVDLTKENRHRADTFSLRKSPHNRNVAHCPTALGCWWCNFLGEGQQTTNRLKLAAAHVLEQLETAFRSLVFSPQQGGASARQDWSRSFPCKTRLHLHKYSLRFARNGLMVQWHFRAPRGKRTGEWVVVVGLVFFRDAMLPQCCPITFSRIRARPVCRSEVFWLWSGSADKSRRPVAAGVGLLDSFGGSAISPCEAPRWRHIFVKRVSLIRNLRSYEQLENSAKL